MCIQIDTDMHAGYTFTPSCTRKGTRTGTRTGTHRSGDDMMTFCRPFPLAFSHTNTHTHSLSLSLSGHFPAVYEDPKLEKVCNIQRHRGALWSCSVLRLDALCMLLFTLPSDRFLFCGMLILFLFCPLTCSQSLRSMYAPFLHRCFENSG